MSVRFVIGRAGVGKTFHCLQAIRDGLRESRLVGPRLILLVPEQASLQVERALVEGLSEAAVHRAQVLSFRRLASRVLADGGDGGRLPLTPAARAMLLRMLLMRHSTLLRYYKGNQRLGGFVEQLGRTITEFVEESVSPDDLMVPQATADDDPILAAKLHDLHLIYQAYLNALGTESLDPSQRLDVARQRLDACDWINGAHVWVDGFAGFSRQERMMLVALASRAERMEVTVLFDGDEVSEAGPEGHRSCDLFNRTRRMIAELRDMFAEQGITIEGALTLSQSPRRFERCPVLAQVERHLFGPAPAGTMPSQGVRIVQAADRRTEVEFAVSQIQQLVQRSDHPLRYRDMAIVVRDLEPYYALASAALQARGIPFFIDRRRSTAHHPLVELLRGLLELAARDYEPDAVRALLKTGFCALDDDDADALENHLLATAIEGRQRWTVDQWPLPVRQRQEPSPWTIAAMQRINRARSKFLQDVDGWVVAATEAGEATGGVWADRIRAILSHLKVQQQVEQWSRQAADEGDLDQAEAHRQSWRDMEALLHDLGTALGDARVTIEELTSIVESAVAQWTLGLAPPMLDQVLVGSIERSRHPEIKVALVLGVNEGLFPSVPAEDSILNDDDRAKLEGQGLRLGTSGIDRVLDEAMLFYITCTRPSESLVVTYAAADQDGRELKASPYLDALCTACPGLEIETVREPFGDRADWAIHTSRDLSAALAYELRHRPAIADDDAAPRGHWNGLYEGVRTDPEMTEQLAQTLGALVYDNKASLRKTSASLGLSDPFCASVSQLETFATCPFRHFAQYRLKLKQRERSELEAMDIGTVHHAIMESFIQKVATRGQSIGELDDTAMLDELGESCRRVAQTMPLAGELSHARDRYMMARSREELARVLEGQKRVSGSSAFRPQAAELRFGFSAEGNLPALELVTPLGRRVLLRGIIDRVDLAQVSDEILGVVVDYKRTPDKRLDLSRVYHGLSLQLLGYLLVLAQRGATLTGRPIKPAGAFYVSLAESYKPVAHPDDVCEKQTRTLPYRPRGLVNMERMSVLDGDFGASGRSDHYVVQRRKDGKISHLDHSDGAEKDAFAALLEHTRNRLAELSDALLNGDIRVTPYRLGTFSPCSWCPFDTVCRFEPGHGQVRFLEKLKRSEVFERLTHRQEPASHA